MMYMPDAIRATIELMEAPAEKVKIRSSYNLAGISFTPKEIAAEISKHISNFEINLPVCIYGITIIICGITSCSCTYNF